MSSVVDACGTEWVAEITVGLLVLHDKNILHRDMKTSNILLGGDLAIRLCDFGEESAEQVQNNKEIRHPLRRRGKRSANRTRTDIVGELHTASSQCGAVCRGCLASPAKQISGALVLARSARSVRFAASKRRQCFCYQTESHPVLVAVCSYYSVHVVVATEFKAGVRSGDRV